MTKPSAPLDAEWAGSAPTSPPPAAPISAPPAHFELRKVALGTCARDFGTPCVHEHACVRCSLLRPDPAQRERLVDIRDNLIARIAEADREGWLGEIEGLQVSLTGAEEKLSQMNADLIRRKNAVDLGMPSFTQISTRTSAAVDLQVNENSP